MACFLFCPTYYLPLIFQMLPLLLGGSGSPWGLLSWPEEARVGSGAKASCRVLCSLSLLSGLSGLPCRQVGDEIQLSGLGLAWAFWLDLVLSCSGLLTQIKEVSEEAVLLQSGWGPAEDWDSSATILVCLFCAHILRDAREGWLLRETFGIGLGPLA